MNQSAVAASPGVSSPQHTSNEFGAFVLQRTSGSSTPSTNKAPVVNAGSNQSITLPASATLAGSATDDGLPNNTLTSRWTSLSGPGTVTFSSPTASANDGVVQCSRHVHAAVERQRRRAHDVERVRDRQRGGRVDGWGNRNRHSGADQFRWRRLHGPGPNGLGGRWELQRRIPHTPRAALSAVRQHQRCTKALAMERSATPCL